MTTGLSGSSYMSSRRSIWMCWCKGCLPMRSPRRRVSPQSLMVCVCSSDLKRALPCLALSCLVLSWLGLSCLGLSCFGLAWLGLSCLVLSCLVLSCLVLSCLVLSSAPWSSRAHQITCTWLCIKPQHCIIDLLLHSGLQQYLNMFARLFYLLASSQTDVSSTNQCTIFYMHLQIIVAVAHASEA